MAEEGFERGVGTGEQLAYGEATDLAAQEDFGEDITEQLNAQAIVDESSVSLDTDVEYSDEDPVFEPGSDLDQVLFGPSEGLGRDYAPPSEAPVPASIVRMLPTLATVVQNPTTPRSIKAAYRLILQRLEHEMRNQ